MVARSLSPRRLRAVASAVVHTVLVAWATVALAQTIPAAPGPDGLAPGSAPTPAATATSPGTSPGSPSAPARPPNGPAPEDRSTSPGTRAVPPGLPTPSRGVPRRIVAPDAPNALPDPVDPTNATAPSDENRRVPSSPGASGTQTVPSPTIPGSLPSAPGPVVAPAAPPVVR